MTKKTGIPNHQSFRYRMAIRMGLDRSQPESWPVEELDRLIDGEQRFGQRWMFDEIKKICCPGET